MRNMTGWTSPVYAFFEPKPWIIDINSQCAHEFKCSAHGCKATVHQFLDTQDTQSTSNMCKHVKSCRGWGPTVLSAADDAKDANEVHTKIIKIFRKGKGKVIYSNQQHTKQETCLQPSSIVEDHGFQCLMKTGHPKHYILSHATISCNVHLVFACTHSRIAKMLQEYDGRLNFTTNGWTSPNHCVLITFSVHLEHKGQAVSMPLDIIEVPWVRTYLVLGCMVVDPSSLVTHQA
ncbi:hypothetical protein EDC04DRAFT_2867974 [Pisolithus marmoratus]|nr:hypothetical protein EDC04DRAFT_2867974 [Pisolithus marmoratus]